jgi:2-dehydropantoate 2-reductase
MKICLYGAGAVGGFIGVQLGRTGCELSVVEVGPTLEALKKHGLRAKMGDEIVQQKITATSNPAELGVQDLVVIAVKGPTLIHVAKGIGPLLGPQTIVLPTMNGVLWWFFHGFGGRHAGMRLNSVDPNGVISAGIPVENVVGCVVQGTFASIEPGLVTHGVGDRLTIGEPDGSASERVRDLAVLLRKTGLEIVVSRSIQNEVWFKLWGNMTHNPISAITGATTDRIIDDPLVDQFCRQIMEEARRIGARIGCVIDQKAEDRQAATRKMGAFKTSMLQDVELGKPVELDSLVAVVREIGQEVGEPTPFIDVLLGLARVHAQVHRLYPQPAPAAAAAGAKE